MADDLDSTSSSPSSYISAVSEAGAQPNGQFVFKDSNFEVSELVLELHLDIHLFESV